MISSSPKSLSSVSVATPPRGWWVYSSIFCVVATSVQAWTLSDFFKKSANML